MTSILRSRSSIHVSEPGQLDHDSASPLRLHKLRQLQSRVSPGKPGGLAKSPRHLGRGRKRKKAEQHANWNQGVAEVSKASRKSSEPAPKRKLDEISGSSSPLSPASQATSPTLAQPKQDIKPSRLSRSPSDSSLDSHQPPPAPSIPQYQTFGPDPLTFNDPTIYHIREITNDMTDEEKKEIYCVSHFPHDDLSSLIAGTPPDKDFSNAKPSNQVNANTFAAYIDPYLRPLSEEDMAFLKERVSIYLCCYLSTLLNLPG